jgi:hypothetical protein
MLSAEKTDGAETARLVARVPRPERSGQAPAGFYGGPVSRKHGAAANATMIDSDDVHQLRASAEPDE